MRKIEECLSYWKTLGFDKSHTLFHTHHMMHGEQQYEFSEEKNEWLIAERGIGFRDVIAAIYAGKLLDILDHHNQKKYPNQKIYIVVVHGYVCAVPVVIQDESTVFLKTIFRTRKLTKKYLNQEGKRDQKTKK